MNTIKKIPIFFITKSIIISIVCLLLTALLCVDETHNQVRFDIYIETNQSDSFSIYWPDYMGRYSESRVQHVHYPAGKSGHAVTIANSLPLHSLRFDPGNNSGEMKINGISISRFGDTQEVSLASLKSKVVSVKDLNVSHTQGITEFLQLNFGSNDAQIFFSQSLIPSSSVLLILTISMVFSFLLVPWFCHKNTPILQEKAVQAIAITLATLLVLEWLNWNESTELIIKILTIYAAIFLSVHFLYQKWSLRSDSSQFLRPIFLCLAITVISGAIYSQTFFSASKLGFYFSSQNETDNSVYLENQGLWLERVKFYKKSFINSLEETFDARTVLVDLNAKIKIFGLHYIGTSKAILGKNGMYFEGYGDRMVEAEVVKSFDNVADYLGTSLYTQQELESWALAIEERYYWHKSKGIDYIFAIAPAKAHIYPENLPDKILKIDQRLDRQSRIDQLMDYLAAYTKVPVVDLRVALNYQRTQDERPLYYRTDFHWNQLGAFYAYEAIVKGINLYYPEQKLQKTNLNEFEVEQSDDWVSFQTMQMVGLDPYKQKNETYYTLTPKRLKPSSSAVNKQVQGEIKVKRLENEKVKFPIIQFSNQSAPERTIFVIGDSFIETTAQFFSRHARKVWNFRAIIDFSQEPYKDERPDIVVQSIHNMYLLQPPPINEQALKQARLDALAVSK